ncbi:hypothetical protein MRX96_042322 [Rhipicephalus microplus]
MLHDVMSTGHMVRSTLAASCPMVRCGKKERALLMARDLELPRTRSGRLRACIPCREGLPLLFREPGADPGKAGAVNCVFTFDTTHSLFLSFVSDGHLAA